MILSVAPSSDLYKGLYGKILISPFWTKLGLKCDQNITVVKSDTKQLSISVSNILSHTIRLRKGMSVAKYTAINRADVTSVPQQLKSINNTQDAQDAEPITSNTSAQSWRPINCAQTNYSLPKSSQGAFDEYSYV